MRHLHFGAGKFGLGFTGSLSRKLGLELILANRGENDTNILSDQNLMIARNRGYDIEYHTVNKKRLRFMNYLTLAIQLSEQLLSTLFRTAEPKC